jgi:hypothetical protein
VEVEDIKEVDELVDTLVDFIFLIEFEFGLCGVEHFLLFDEIDFD